MEVFREIGCQGRFCLLARRCRSGTRARGALSHGLRDCRLYESTACNRSCAAAREFTPPDRARMRRTRPPRRSIVHQHERIAVDYSRWRHDPIHRRQTAQDAAGSIRAPTRHDGMAGTPDATIRALRKRRQPAATRHATKRRKRTRRRSIESTHTLRNFLLGFPQHALSTYLHRNLVRIW